MSGKTTKSFTVRSSLLASVPRLVRANPIIWAIIAMIIAFSAIEGEAFLSTRNFISILRGFAVTSALALGPTFVVLTGRLDLSYVGIWMFSNTLAWLLFPYMGYYSLLICPVFGTFIGFLNGVIHAKLKAPAFISTLSVTAVLAFLTTIIRNMLGQISLTVPPPEFAQNWPIPFLPLSFLLALPAITLAIFVMFFTKLGTYFCAIGSDEEAVTHMGVSKEKYLILAFTISGMLTGLGSIAIFVHLGWQAKVLFDLDDVVRGLAAIVLGGTPLSGGMGGPQRTLLGALAYVLIFNGLFLLPGIDPNQLKLYIGAMLFIAVIATSKGLKGIIMT